MTTATETRFTTALYTAPEAARYLNVPPTTLRTWAQGYTRTDGHGRTWSGAPVITAFAPARRHEATIPFIGLAEGMTLAAFRRSGVPLQRIRPALEALKATVGLDHALASDRLYTDGVEVIYDYGERTGDRDVQDLVVVRDNQRMFSEVVQDYLKRIDFGSDGYATMIRLPAYRESGVVVDPRRGFGQPIFSQGGARVEDVLGAFQAGQSLQSLESEFGIERATLEDAIRVATLAA